MILMNHIAPKFILHMPPAGFEAKRTTTGTIHEEGHHVCLLKHRTQCQ